MFKFFQEKLSMDDKGKEGDDVLCHVTIHMSCHFSTHMSCHANIVYMSGKGWSIVDGQGSVRFVNNIGLSGKMTDNQWPMIRHQHISWVTFGLRRKTFDDRWSMIEHQRDWWEGLVCKGNHRSSIADHQ